MIPRAEGGPELDRCQNRRREGGVHTLIDVSYGVVFSLTIPQCLKVATDEGVEVGPDIF